jgi:alkanesulfonate monooxygenase SsuD/methylene tetrahydromethanopterin reductase-like flavin-dependent oxidoreductase (luciferase family)
MLMHKRTETGAFDFEGQYFEIQGAYAEPKPLQKPYPLIMNVGLESELRIQMEMPVDLSI